MCDDVTHGLTFFSQNEGKEERKTVSFWVDPHLQKGSPNYRGDLRVNSTHYIHFYNMTYTIKN